MSQPQQPGRQQQQQQAQPPAPSYTPFFGSPLALLQRAQQPQNENIIPNVDIMRLMRFVFEDRPQVALEKDMETVKEILDVANRFARELIDTFVRDGLQRIIHPRFGESSIKARFWSVATLLTKLINEKWGTVIKAMDSKASPAEVHNTLREAMLVSEMAPLIMTRVYDMLINLAFLNAPAKLRPPLANVALGYDMLG